MSRLDRSRGLIDFESWSNIERGRRNEAPVNRLVRPKTIGLAAACLALAVVIVFSFATRTDATLSVQHDRDPLTVRLADGSLRNGYTVKLLNKSSTSRAYRLSISGAEADMMIVGRDNQTPITLEPGESETLRVTLTMTQPREGDIIFMATDEAGENALAARDRFLVK